MANTPGSDNPFPSVLFAEHVDPATPGAGTQRLFVDTDGLLKLIDDAGTVVTFPTSSSSGTLTTVEEVDGSPTNAGVTKLVFPNGTLGIVGTVATYTPTAGGVLVPVTAAVATDQTLTGNNSFVDLTTAGPAVTITVNTIVEVTVSAECSWSAAGYAAMGFAASGANTIAAARGKAYIASGDAAGDHAASRSFLLTGLTPGSTTFTAKYNQLGGGGTTHWGNRELSVKPWN